MTCGVPAGSRTQIDPFGGDNYIHLTTGTILYYTCKLKGTFDIQRYIYFGKVSVIVIV